MRPGCTILPGQDPDRARWVAWRGQHCRAVLPRGIAQSLYYTWSKEFMDAGKCRLAGDTVRAATSDEVRNLRREVSALKEP